MEFILYILPKRIPHIPHLIL